MGGRWEMLTSVIGDSLPMFGTRCSPFPIHTLIPSDIWIPGATILSPIAFIRASLQVGYVQGMGFIAAVLLLHMPQEEAFWSFVALMEGRGAIGGRGRGGSTTGLPARPPLRGLFQEAMPGLQLCLRQYEALLASEIPRLAAHMQAEGLGEVSLYATHWFNTLFSYALPFEHVLRIWDVFMLEVSQV